MLLVATISPTTCNDVAGVAVRTPKRLFATSHVRFAVCNKAVVVLPINTCPAVKVAEPVPPLATANVPLEAFAIFKAVILAPAPAIFAAVKVPFISTSPLFAILNTVADILDAKKMSLLLVFC